MLHILLLGTKLFYYSSVRDGILPGYPNKNKPHWGGGGITDEPHQKSHNFTFTYETKQARIFRSP